MYPQIIPKKAEPRDATVYPKAVFARVHPNSFDNGFKKTDIEPIVPNDKAVRVNTEITITHPYKGSLTTLLSSLNFYPLKKDFFLNFEKITGDGMSNKRIFQTLTLNN